MTSTNTATLPGGRTVSLGASVFPSKFGVEDCLYFVDWVPQHSNPINFPESAGIVSNFGVIWDGENGGRPAIRVSAVVMQAPKALGSNCPVREEELREAHPRPASEVAEDLIRQVLNAHRTASPKPDPMNVTHQLAELKSLEDGWFDGGGKAFDSVFLDQLAYDFERWYSADAEGPYIYPMLICSVRAEWTLDESEISLVISPLEYEGYWHCLDFCTGEAEERYLDLTSKAAWDWITVAIEGKVC